MLTVGNVLQTVEIIPKYYIASCKLSSVMKNKVEIVKRTN